MILASLENIQEQTLSDLCQGKCPESETLDFKRELPGSLDQNKQELLKDVSALANTNGGDIVYGIDEADGVASALSPITSEEPDAAIRRLTQVLDAGLDPRVNGIKFQPVPIKSGYALVVRVPQSFDGPHCCRSGSNKRFVIRNGPLTSDMTMDQIRSAFGQTASLIQKANNFISERCDAVSQRRTPRKLINGPVLTVHLVPLEALVGRKTVDIKKLHDRDYTQFLIRKWGGGNRDYNLDGLIIGSGSRNDPEGVHGFTQIFRNGVIETVNNGGGELGGNKEPTIWKEDMSIFFHEAAEVQLNAARKWGYSGPAVLSIAVLGALNYQLNFGYAQRLYLRMAIDRSNLIVPSAWISDLSTVSLDEALQPIMDTLWQGFGLERCPDFDLATGKYKEPNNW